MDFSEFPWFMLDCSVFQTFINITDTCRSMRQFCNAHCNDFRTKKNRTIRSNVKDFFYYLFYFFELPMSYSNNSHVLTCRLSTWGLDILQFSKIVAWTAQHGKQVKWLCYSHIYVYFYLIVKFTIWRWIRKSCKQHRGHWHTMR